MPNILYLHGFASGPLSNKARFFANRFAQIGADVHCPDLAEGDFTRLTLTKQLKLIDRLAQELNPAMIIGSSLGGYLAAIYGSLHPERAPRLLLLAPAFGFPHGWEQRLGKERMAEWEQKGSIEVYHYAAGETRPIGYEFYEDAAWYDRFPDVRQPTLIYHGKRDDDVSPDLSVKFAWGKPNVQLDLVDSDHSLGDVLERIWRGAADFYQQAETVSAGGA
jgi:pimeloyl-ACP methyl ester carboxylesterase